MRHCRCLFESPASLADPFCVRYASPSPKTKSMSRIYITFPSPSPFCWCIIKHVFCKMKESDDKRGLPLISIWIAPISCSFPAVYLSFSLVWVYSCIIFSVSLTLCHSLIPSFVLLSFCFVCYSNIFLSLLIVDSYCNQYICMCDLTIKIQSLPIIYLLSLSLSVCTMWLLL